MGCDDEGIVFDDVEIVFKARRFCFTGHFHYGNQDECGQEVERLGEKHIKM